MCIAPKAFFNNVAILINYSVHPHVCLLYVRFKMLSSRVPLPAHPRGFPPLLPGGQQLRRLRCQDLVWQQVPLQRVQPGLILYHTHGISIILCLILKLKSKQQKMLTKYNWHSQEYAPMIPESSATMGPTNKYGLNIAYINFDIKRLFFYDWGLDSIEECKSDLYNH